MSYAQFGPGGVGDSDEILLWLHNRELNNMSLVNPQWNDIGMYGNHAATIPLNLPTIDPNRFGDLPGAQFNGLQFLTVPHAPIIDLDQPFTMAAVYGSSDPAARFILSKGGDTSNSEGFSLSTLGTNIRTRVSDGSTDYFDSVSHVGISSPDHVLSSFDKSSRTVTMATSTNTSLDFPHGSGIGNTSNSENLVIGGGPFGNLTDNWIGFLGEIIILDLYLNEAQQIILRHYLGVVFQINFTSSLYAHGATFNHDLAGIGRVDGSNEHGDSKGLGMVRIDNPDDMDDGEFLFWAHDDQKTSSGGSNENLWRVDETGDVGLVRVQLYMQGYNITNINEIVLVVADNSGLTGATPYVATNWDGGTEIMTFENVDLGTNDYFTFQFVSGLPVIDECPLDITTVNEPGVCEATVGWVPPVSNGTLTSSHNPGDTFPVGTTTVTYTATNAEGTTTCTFDVTVNDTEPPVLSSCPADIIINDDDDCQENVNWTPPTASDNCNVTLNSTHNPGQVFTAGTTTVTYTATDDAGNSVSCSFDVILTDSDPPILENCPNDITVNTDISCDQMVTWTAPTATDNCSVSLTSTHNSGDRFPVGSTTVTYTATDDGGNQSSCSFTVTVLDNTPPAISDCNPTVSISDYQAATADAIAQWDVPTADDNCTIAAFTSSHKPGDRFPVGTTTVTYEAEDQQGNSSTCSFEVTVTAINTPPEVKGTTYNVNAGETVTICLEATDPEGDNISLDQVQSTGLRGTIGAVDRDNLCFDYTAPEDFEGNESIPVVVCDDGDPQECTQQVLEMKVEIVWELGISQLVTPNGDGINDIWYIGNIDKYPDNRVVIFDRWGGKIYQAENYNNSSVCWSGNREDSHNSSGGAPSGTYFYQIEISDGRSFKGFLELVGE